MHCREETEPAALSQRGSVVAGNPVSSLECTAYPPRPTAERLLTVKNVTALLGISRSTFYHQVARDPRFPLPRKLIGKTHRWLLSEVETYMRGLPREREGWWRADDRKGRAAA